MEEENFDSYELEEDMRLVDRLTRATQIKQQQQAIARQNELSSAAMQEAFKEAGIEPAQWQKIIAENPELAEQTFKNGVKNFVQGVVKGRETTKQQAPQAVQEETGGPKWDITPAQGFTEATAHYRPSEKLKEAAKVSGKDDVLDMMVAEICAGMV